MGGLNDKDQWVVAWSSKWTEDGSGFKVESGCDTAKESSICWVDAWELNLIICIRPIIYIHFILTFILFFAHQVALELCKPLLRLCQLWYFAN